MKGCPSCGGPVKRLEIICALCRVVVLPVPIQEVIPVVMAEIEAKRKDAA